MYYYNHERPHQGLNGKTPVQMLETPPKSEDAAAGLSL